MERGWKEMPPNCPRCGSTNTKFCYYNNYSLTQPRYFCKGCRRYWTKGGSLRNVPVGGGCRKSRRGNKPSLRTSSAPTATTPYANATPTSCRRIVSAFGHVIMNSDGPSSSSSSSASTIDLAVVYANFLNPKTTQEREENQRARLPYYHHSNYHDPLVCSPLDQIPIISKANMDLALSSHEAYLEEQDDQLLLVHHHHHHHKQQVQGDHHMMQNPSSSTYNHDHVKNGVLLPPLPGEEEAGMRPIFQEVVIPLEKNNNPTHDHLISYSNDHNPQTETPFSSLFNVDDGCWSPLDFSEIETPMATTTTTTTTISQHQWP